MIEKTQRPTLILAPNKSLAAQLAQEFREFFPHNRVEYFVSYYDYYQPEAYIPSSDTYIEKDSSINEEIDRLRHSATAALLTRRDTIVVASVSCIYGMGNPEEYRGQLIDLSVGVDYDMRSILRRLVDMQFDRNDATLGRGKFRVRGDTIEVHPSYEESVLRIEMFGDTVDRLTVIDPLTGETLRDLSRTQVFPATHYVAGAERMAKAMTKIEAELQERLAYFEKESKLLEAQRLRMRTSVRPRDDGRGRVLQRHRELLDAHRRPRASGSRRSRCSTTSPTTSSSSSTRVTSRCRSSTASSRATAVARTCSSSTASACRRRVTTARSRSTRCSSGSTRRLHVGHAERVRVRVSEQVVEQIVRPTGLVDPEVIVKPTKGQIDDLIEGINDRVERGDRVLVTTLTKKMAEDLTEYLLEQGLRVRYLHCNIDTIQRIEILRALRLGEFDVLVGINLLREGLDLPEVSLVAILDADKEGFLRCETSLIQTIGRAARNVDGQVVMYADRITDSMQQAIDITQQQAAPPDRLQRGTRHQPADHPQGRGRHPLVAPARRHVAGADEGPTPPARAGQGAARAEDDAAAGDAAADPDPRGRDARGVGRAALRVCGAPPRRDQRPPPRDPRRRLTRSDTCVT